MIKRQKVAFGKTEMLPREYLKKRVGVNPEVAASLRQLLDKSFQFNPIKSNDVNLTDISLTGVS